VHREGRGRFTRNISLGTIVRVKLSGIFQVKDGKNLAIYGLVMLVVQ